MLLWENEALLSNLGFLAGGCLLAIFLTLASDGAGIDWNKVQHLFFKFLNLKKTFIYDHYLANFPFDIKSLILTY